MRPTLHHSDVHLDYDDSAPTVTVTPDRVPDHNGWYNHAVIFDTDGTDATSGIAACDPNPSTYQRSSTAPA